MSERKPRWEVVLTRQAEKTLYRLSKNLLQPLDQALLALAEDPRPLESHLLPGHDNLYRLPVTEWRITYAVEDERLLVLVLEIALKQQPERYRLEEEPDNDFSPDPPPLPGQTGVSSITELRPQPLPGPGGDFLYRAPGLLKRLRKEKIRLLIGDYDQESRENLRQQLFGEAAIEIVGIAANAEETIQMAVEQQPDLVLLDTHLPGLDGFTTCERIVRQVPSIQIIMMSVHGEADYFRRAMQAGAREFLIKPFSGLELAVSIRRVYRSAAWQRLHDTGTASYLLDTFDDLKERLRARLMAELEPRMDVSRPEEVRQLIQDRFDQILAQENIILSRSERKRLFEAVVTEIQLRLTKSEQQPTQPSGEVAVDPDEAQIKAEALWFKLYKLGNRSEISLSAKNLSESLAFYGKLGFARVEGGEEPYPWAVISDGRLHLGLYQQVFSSPTLSYFHLNATLEERLSHLAKLGVRLDDIQVPGLKLVTAEFETPEGQHVILADIWSGMKTAPAGKKFFSRYGTFSELTLTTKDVKAAVAYWKQLGFECVTEGDRPYPWAVISDGLIRLGFHQTTKLTQSTITYFAPDMPDRLKRLRQKGIKFKDEQKDKKGRRVGAVIESPDGQLFFFFTGETKAQLTGTDTSMKESGGNGRFKVGQTVRIIEGPFADFMGIVKEVDQDRARVRVQLAFFGQDKSLEFDFLQIEHA
ncbi:MAG: response regulator [Anaerolineales bacterium]|nr:response regulator [Anaerolineales bacterium]